MGAEVNTTGGCNKVTHQFGNHRPSGKMFCTKFLGHSGSCDPVFVNPNALGPPPKEETPKMESTLVERGHRYGSFTSQSALAQSLEDIMRSGARWPDTTPSQREAFSMIAIKIARLLNGDPHYADGWHDIAGYAKLVEDEIHEPDERELP